MSNYRGGEFRLKLKNQPMKFITVAVHYRKATTDARRGEDIPGVIYLSASPITVTPRSDGIKIVSQTLYSSTTTCIEEATRLNRKRLSEVLREAQGEIALKKGKAWEAVWPILEANGHELDDEQPIVSGQFSGV